MGFVTIDDEHVDLGKPGLDRGLGPAVAGTDDEFAVDLTGDGWLNDADRLDGGDELRVHLLARRRAAGVLGIEDERLSDHAA